MENNLQQEGPALEYLLRRLSECPPEFVISAHDKTAVAPAAVVSDLLQDLGGHLLTPGSAAPFQLEPNGKNRNYINIILIACWLLHDSWFRQQQRFAESAYNLFRNGLSELSKRITADKFIYDADRREELVRLVLQALELRPKGESPEQAADRLKTLDSIERERVIREAKKAEERAKELREAMARQAAIEAASKMPRE